jgi:hypothetical protein
LFVESPSLEDLIIKYIPIAIAAAIIMAAMSPNKQHIVEQHDAALLRL